MVQFKRCDKRDIYEIIVSGDTVIGHISEEDNITLYNAEPTSLVRNVLLHWTEYGFQLSRDLDDFADNTTDKKGE